MPESAHCTEIPRLSFNQQEAAEALGISVTHFERQVNPDLPVIYTGSLRLYSLQALERWLATHTVHRRREVA